MKKQFDPSQWISQAEAAKLRKVTRQAIAGLVKNRRLTTFNIGGKVLVKRSEIEAFVPKRAGRRPRKK